MRDGWMMDILYLLCELYCKWYCNCNIVVVCNLTVMLIFVFVFQGFLYDQIKYNPNDGVCVLSTAHPNPQQWRPMSLGVWSWCRVSVGSSADRRQTSDTRQWCVSGPPGCAKNTTQQTACVTARRRETCSGLIVLGVLEHLNTGCICVYLFEWL